MKTCPYCAEKIQHAAIVCRYCGRDLPAPSPSAVETTPPAARKASFWSRGPTKAAIVISILYIIEELITPKTDAELLGRLTIGLIATFLFWWLICAGIAWLWKKIGGGAFVGLVIGLGIIAVIIVLASQGSATPSTVIAPTPMATSNFAATIGALLTQTSEAQAVAIPTRFICFRWDHAATIRAGMGVCVYGNIYSQTQVVPEDYVGMYTLIRFNDDVHSFYLTSQYHLDVSRGDCVRAFGVLKHDPNGVPFMQVDKVQGCG